MCSCITGIVGLLQPRVKTDRVQFGPGARWPQVRARSVGANLGRETLGRSVGCLSLPIPIGPTI